MTNPEPPEVPVTLSAFAVEVVEAMRAAGVTENVTYDAVLAELVVGDRRMPLAPVHRELAKAPDDRRRDAARQLAEVFLRPPTLPATWDEASRVVLPSLVTRFATVRADARASAQGKVVPTPRAEFTSHAVMELCVASGAARATVPLASLTAWGISPDVAFQAALHNLAARSEAQWLGSPEAAGVYRSPWKDGFDASRIALPQQFARVPLRGRAVVLAPTPSQLLLAGSDDVDGLFHLARFARRHLEANRTIFMLRALCMGEDGESWDDWEPPRDHAAYDAFRFLRAAQEVYEATEQAALVREMIPPGQSVLEMPPLEMVQSPLGETRTVTTWATGRPAALPRADLIVFRRGKETLGFATWEQVERALPDVLFPLPGYPTRYRVTDFPEGWQLDGVGLEPWGGA